MAIVPAGDDGGGLGGSEIVARNKVDFGLFDAHAGVELFVALSICVTAAHGDGASRRIKVVRFWNHHLVMEPGTCSGCDWEFVDGTNPPMTRDQSIGALLASAVKLSWLPLRAFAAASPLCAPRALPNFYIFF